MPLYNENKLPSSLLKPIPVPPRIINNQFLVEKNECAANAHRISGYYHNINIVEGIILLVKDSGLEFIAHVWNELEGHHFDITAHTFFPKLEAYYLPIISLDIHESIKKNQAIPSEETYKKAEKMNNLNTIKLFENFLTK